MLCWSLVCRMRAAARARQVFTAVSASRCVSVSTAPATLTRDSATVTQAGRVRPVTPPVLQVSTTRVAGSEL